LQAGALPSGRQLLEKNGFPDGSEGFHTDFSFHRQVGLLQMKYGGVPPWLSQKGA
jgi:hypothetical protein